MKVGWLVPGFPGTGGGRINAIIFNELIRLGVDLHIFSSNGIMDTRWIPTMGLDSGMNSKVKDIKELGEKWDGVLVTSDFGPKEVLLKYLDQTEAKLKIFYVILMNRDIIQRLRQNDLLVVSSTPYFYRQLGGYGCTNNVMLVGPSDDNNFYPLGAQYHRNNLCLTFPKKSGWVVVDAFKIAQVHEDDMLAAPMGLGEEKWEGVRLCEWSLPAHDVGGLRTLYSKCRMFICSDGGAQWGFNYSLAEAALCQLPIVSTDWEGFEHIVENNVTALAVPWNHAPCEPWNEWMVRPSPLELGMRMIELYRNKELAERLARNARERVLQYNVKDWCRKFKELL